ncbi:hypothetical protein EDD18DRAFT_1074138, partial [Armillaria luteobubalina]
PLTTFSSCVDEYVVEILRREGCGDAISQTCCSALGCEDTDFHFCYGRLFCQICIISLHEACLTHVIQVSTPLFLDRTWFLIYFAVPLHELGMWYQVGHLAGEVCLHPWPAFGNHFTIIDTNGVHDIALDFCSCMWK